MAQGVPVGERRPQTRSPQRMRCIGVARSLLVGSIVVTTIVLLGLVPGFLGSAAAAALPWLIVPVAILVLLCLLIRRRSWIVVAVPVLVWTLVTVPSFGWTTGLLEGGEDRDSLVVAGQNVEAGSGTAGESARELAAQGADVIALTELAGDARDEAEEVLGPTHPFSYAVGTVGIWSTLPIIDRRPLELGLGWKRALAVDLETPVGALTVFVIHAASLRPGDQEERDTMLAELAGEIARSDADRIIALGDFNAAPTDPALNGIRGELTELASSFPEPGFTWPATFPAVRIDHVYQRGLTPRESMVHRAGASDHLAVITRFGL